MKQTDRYLKHLRGQYSKSIDEREKPIQEDQYPHHREPALIHPENHSVVKLRDSGTIDIFAGKDMGLRIDPTRHTINVLSNKYMERIGSSHRQITDNATEAIGGVWALHAEGGVNITGGDINLQSENITLKGNVTVKGTLTEEKGDDE